MQTEGFIILAQKGHYLVIQMVSPLSIENLDCTGGLKSDLMTISGFFKATMRVDKNENFKFLPSPAISLIWQPNKKHTLRGTFTSAIRNPTLLNQYMYYNVGRARLVGNVSGYDSLVTIESLRGFIREMTH